MRRGGRAAKLSRLPMRRLALALFFASTAAGAAAPRVAVLPYQGLGAEPAAVARLAAALRTSVAAQKWSVVDAAESEKSERAAAMCGEDVECLATLGQRLGARYLLAFGVGRVGQGVMVSALLVEVSPARLQKDAAERLSALPEDAQPLGHRLVEALFAGLSPPPALLPVEAPPPPPPLVVAPAAPGRRLKPWAIGTTIGAGALAVGGGVLTVLAQQKFAALPDVALSQRPAAESAQRTLNAAADATVATAALAGVAAVVLFFLDAPGATQ